MGLCGKRGQEGQNKSSFCGTRGKRGDPSSPLMSPHDPQEGDIPLKSIDPQFQPLKLISLVSKVREKSVLHRPASVSWSY